MITAPRLVEEPDSRSPWKESLSVSRSEELLAYLAKALVGKPEEVAITSESEGDALVLKVQVNPEDLGRLIGRGGRTAKALREVIGKAAACNKEGKVQVVILE